jgi:hypothetical protein
MLDSKRILKDIKNIKMLIINFLALSFFLGIFALELFGISQR